MLLEVAVRLHIARYNNAQRLAEAFG